MNQPLRRGVLLVALPALLLSSCKKETPVSAPTVTTMEVTNLTHNTVSCGGSITTDGGEQPSAMGVCWSTGSTPTVADAHTENQLAYNKIDFWSAVSGLTAGTTYNLRAYATNSGGTGYGNTVTFTTPAALLPTIKTVYPTKVTRTAAQLGLEVTAEGGAPVTAKGICWGTSANPTVADAKLEGSAGMGAFTSTLTGLTANTTYYARAYATNVAGTVYGPSMVIRTMYGTVTDIDGNEYYTVLIGTQEWMAENLKVTRYRNGDPLPNITDAAQWAANTSIGAWCAYDNDITNKASLGLLYNHFAIEDNRGVCPAGWHVPSKVEWDNLINYLGGAEEAWRKLYRSSSNVNADNSSGFNAITVGGRSLQGTFYGKDQLTGFWTITRVDFFNKYYNFYIDLYSGNSGFSDTQPCYGYSIRCIKDN